MTQTEQTFLHILGTALTRDKVPAGSLPEDTDWEGLARLAAEHKVLPLLVSALPPEQIPGGGMLKRRAIQQSVLQTQRTVAFLSLYRAMTDAGFHPLVVKGILCRGLYPQPDLRPSSDEDLFLPDEEFESCCRWLREQGFAASCDPGETAFEIGWRKDNLYIELHRRLFSPESGAYGDLNRFFSPEGIPYSTEYAGEVLSLEPHSHMLYLLLHAYKHFLHSGFGIRQVCDICLWAQRYQPDIVWPLLAAQCRECHAFGFASAVFGIGRHFLGISPELPDNWQVTADYCLPMLEDLLAGGIYGSADSSRQHTATMTLNAVEASRRGSRPSAAASLFPPRSAMEGRFPYLKKHPILLPLAWSQRILGYLGRKNRPGESLRLGRERVALLQYYNIIQ